MTIRTGFFLACILAGLAIDVAVSRGRLVRPGRRVVLCTLLVAAFAANGWALYQLWSGRAPTYFAFGGILPWRDAAAYYEGARHVMATGSLDGWSSRRPLRRRCWLGS